MIRALRFLIIISCSAVTSCNDTNFVQPIATVGTVRGIITIFSEYAVPETDRSGVKITLTGVDQTYTALTNTLGEYVIPEVLNDTYTVSLERAGLVKIFVAGFKVLGGSEPTYLHYSMVEECTTNVTDLLLSANSGSISIKGKFAAIEPARASGIIFLSTSPDVSPTNYISTVSVFAAVHGAEFNLNFFYNAATYKSGETMYAVAYGVTGLPLTQFNLETKRNTFLSLGKQASNHSSVTIP